MLAGRFEGPLDDWRVWVESQGVTVVFVSGQLPESVRVSWGDGTPASEALREVAVQHEDEADVFRRSSRVYAIGEPSQDDYQVRVFRVTGGEAEQYRQAVEPMLSKWGTVQAVGDSLVVRDLRVGMDQASRVIPALVGARGQWLVEVRLVEFTRQGARELGLDWSQLGEVRVGVSSDGVFAGVARAELAAMLAAEETDTAARLINFSRLHVVEGSDASMQVGQTVPVPIKTVSDAGTVTTTDYREIDTGVLLEVGIRSEPDGLLRLRLKPELSQISGFVDGIPIRSRRRLQSEVVLAPGGVVILGGHGREQSRASWHGLPGVKTGLVNEQTEHVRLFVVVRVIDPSEIHHAAD